ncbi:dolichol-phosphate mannosyltransferase subunit 3-like protein [Protomyces lactucae-debilis]|uniref:Dolichol-phosphate mannosyltransferase subunit 3 n=1 Tax=Protomyces lactucae-debilis TaxID=2754530 RepID=A0A1Y2FC26_PROLT|nr:dolichol-phosphate mannosyltransferase subunit 3-like protein [Protomyces lactucae-debilis]ORY81472.1 dolichol-phosphate mannosyltransferase subunit 3-like protein [Protomyces lactucae-debilis]
MTKASRLFADVLTAFILWVVLLLDYVPLPASVKSIIPVLPLWAIVSFGAYLLGTLGWNIFTFQDKHDAYKSLLKEIEEAKEDLRGKGVTVD